MFTLPPRPPRRTTACLLFGAAATAALLSAAAPLSDAHDAASAGGNAAAGAAPPHAASLLAGADGGVDAHVDADDAHLAMPQAEADAPDFFSAFTQSLLLILACELGDRTFFVAAILAMKAPRLVVFAGAISALALMTVLSAAMGRAFPLILDKKYTSVAASVLFAYFGVQLLRTWWSLRNADPGENEELAEVEEELNSDKAESRKTISRGSLGALTALLSPVFIKSFTMTGLAEWGDRSQIATIALAAAQNMWGVILGGIVGHACCTSLAVIGGRLLATRISEKAVALTGGLLFLSFAVLTATGKLE